MILLCLISSLLSGIRRNNFKYNLLIFKTIRIFPSDPAIP